MLRFEETVETAETPAPVEDEDAQLADVPTDTETGTDTDTDTDTETGSAEAPVQESPTGAAARMLEVAAATAEEIVAIAQAHAEAILEASRQQALEAAAELDRERTTTLAGLAEEKAELEARITTLRSLHDDHRSRMRRQLTQQLDLLEHAGPERTADVG